MPELVFRIEDEEAFELASLLRGEIRLQTRTTVEIYQPFSDETTSLSLQQLDLLASIPSNSWVATSSLLSEGIEEQTLSYLIHGKLLAVEDDPRWHARESVPWHPVAALFHSVSLCARESGDRPALIDLEQKQRDSSEDVARYIERHGRPPATRLRFHGSASGSRGERTRVPRMLLDVGDSPDDSFFHTLSQRRTWRHFSKTPVPLEKVSRLLRWTFGIHATIEMSSEYTVPLKTSPSGGGMHPIEAFPIVLAVAGVESGIYYYDAFDHSLELIRAAPRSALEDLVCRLASGQAYLGSAGVAVLLVARLGRNFWKYPCSSRTYAVIHQDAGHLSQTFYLTATRLGLGSVYTAAIDGRETRALLGLEDLVDAPIGICGCGLPDPEASQWFDRRPHVPRDAPAEVESEDRFLTEDAGGSAEASTHPRLEMSASSRHFRNLRISPPFEEEG